MNTNEWITDRLPNDDDGIPGLYLVWNELGRLVHIAEINEGEAWKPLPLKCEPYVKRKRVRVVEEKRYGGDGFDYAVWFRTGTVARHIPTREAAERIAAIYEEVMP